MKKSFILNLVLFALVLFSVLWMMSGISFNGTSSAFSAASLGMFRYFTVDSNVLMGLVALWYAIMEYRVISGKADSVPAYCYVLYLTGAVGTTLTMLVTIFFLAPSAGSNWMSLFTNSSFFMHLINPLLAIVIFICFERTKTIRFIQTPIGMIPLLIYAVYYIAEAVIHSVDDRIMPGYDWYGFFMFGLKSVYIVAPIIVLVTFVISVTLWKLNRRRE